MITNKLQLLRELSQSAKEEENFSLSKLEEKDFKHEQEENSLELHECHSESNKRKVRVERKPI